MSAFAEFAAVDSSSSSISTSREGAAADRAGVCVGSPTRSWPDVGSGNATQVLLIGCGHELQLRLHDRLGTSRWSLSQAASGSEALNILAQGGIDVVVVATSLPDLDARELQQLIALQFPDVHLLSLDDVIGPPRYAGETSLLSDALFLHERSLEAGAVKARVSDAPQSSRPSNDWQGIIGGSPEMQRIFQVANLVGRRDVTVLIQGESGTGKDLLARAIHNVGSRAKQPFVVINCAAIPDTLLEAELFGYTKGAFTGASQARMGRVHAAHGGTLFLDEIGDMPLPLQSKILRFLEQGEIQRIGGADTLKVDCRIIAATNADLVQQVKARQFREDLYYRLAVMPIAMPPLRERMQDLPALCAGFLQRFSPGTPLHHRALELLMQHSWPGNVRELRNVMERASLFAEGSSEIHVEHIVL